MLSLFFSFFFFQAEDGIRDHCVTGVQTCALPISLDVVVSEVSCSPPATSTSSARATSAVHSSSQYGHGSSKRSEERRVGKSVDLGGRRIIKKKKNKDKKETNQDHEKDERKTEREQ